MSRRAAAAIVALVLLLAAFAVAAAPFGHTLATSLLARMLGAASGDDVALGDQHLGWTHASFRDVRVRVGSDPLLEARRIDVDYDLRGLLPGGSRRFGLVAIDVQRPIVSLVRPRDGAFGAGGGAGLRLPGWIAAAPLRFRGRVSDGELRLIDPAPREPDLALQSVVGVTVAAAVDSRARSDVRVRAAWIGRETAGSPLRQWPLAVGVTADAPRGIALARVTVPALPIRGLLGFLLHSPVATFSDGVLRGIDVSAFSLEGADGRSSGLRLGGGARLEGAEIRVKALAVPLRDLGGRIDLFDDGVAAPEMHATLAGIPLRIRGGMYDFADPRFRLGVSADGDGAGLRRAFAFMADKPLAGPVHLETLVTGTASSPLIRTAFSSPRMAYGGIAVDRAGAIIDYAGDAVSVAAGDGRLGPLALTLDGDVDIVGRGTPLRFLLGVHGTADALPYLQNVASNEAVDGLGLVSGTAEYGLHAGGVLRTAGPGGDGAGFIAVDRHGVGEFGPFAFHRPDGASLVGALRLDRPTSSAAGWVAIDRYRFDAPPRLARLPGLELPAFPPLAGTIDGAVVAGGSPADFRLGGRIAADDLRYDRFAFGHVQADLGGTFADLRFRRIDAVGPLGRFRGDAAVRGGTIALAGNYAGTLGELETFTGPIGARGGVRSPIAAVFGPGGIVVQSVGARLDRASVRGIPVDTAAATLTLRGNAVRVVAADAVVGGARVVAAAHAPDAVAVSAVDVPAAVLRGAGIPLQRGRLSLFGLADLHGPTFAGAIDLEDGLAGGYPVHGWADLRFTGSAVEVAQGIGAVGATYGSLGGRVDAVTSARPRYRLGLRVPLGDAGALVRDLRLPVGQVAGTYTADLAITGSGAAPSIAGTAAVPEAAVRGIALRDGSVRFGLGSLAPLALQFDDGTVTAGSSTIRFGGALSQGRLALRAAAPALDLSDFDGYFSESNALAGRGSADLRLTTDGRTTTSAGTIDLAGTRLRRFPLGTVAARWGERAGAIAGDVSLRGPAGAFRLGGTIAPGAGSPLDAFRRARFDLDLGVEGADLATWIPAAGLTAPILGAVDGRAHLAGALHALQGTVEVSLRDGLVGTYPVRTAGARLQLDGEQVTVAQAAADLGVATLGASGHFSLAPTGPLDLHLHAAAQDVAAALRPVLPRAPLPDRGALDVDVTLGGSLNRPRLTAGLDFEQGSWKGFSIPRALASLSSDLQNLQLQSVAVELAGGRAFLAGELPLSLQPPGLGSPDAPVSLTLDAEGIDLRPFAVFLPSGTQLGGRLDGQLAFEGTVGDPRVLGDVTLRDGSFVSSFESAPIRGLGGTLRFNGTSVALQAFHADVGGGTVDASGELNLPIARNAGSAYSVRIASHGARLDFPGYGGGRLDGVAQIVSGRRQPTLSGDLTLSDATIPFAAIYRAAGGESGEEPSPLDLGFNLVGHVGKNVRVRSPIIDVGVAGDVDLQGSLRAPRLAGTLSATRGGIFSTYQRAFRIEEAKVRFDPAAGIVPTIDLRATAHVSNPDPDPSRNPIGNADITVSVAGPADALTISFASDPPYPQAQIIGLLVDAQLLGAVNFNAPNPAGILPGAPGESNVLLPPGVTPYLSGSFGFQQEAFSLLNTQVTQRVIAPIEQIFGTVLGLDDLAVTVDYGGRIGYTARRTIDRRSNLAVNVGQILSYPTRTQFGFDVRPDSATSASFTYFQQAASPSVTLAGASPSDRTLVLTGVQPYSNRQGFRLNLTRRYP